MYRRGPGAISREWQACSISPFPSGEDFEGAEAGSGGEGWKPIQFALTMPAEAPEKILSPAGPPTLGASENAATAEGSVETVRLRPVARQERVAAIDTLRGFAILGILPMNLYAFAMPFPAYANPLLFGGSTGLAFATWVVNHLLFDQKCTVPGFLDTSLTISGSFGRRSRKRRTRMPQDRRGGVSPYLG